MGVVGLLPLLQPVTRRVNVFAECRGKAVAVDASVWLHQVARQYAGDAPQEVGGSPSEEYVQLVAKAFMHRVQTFSKHGIDVVIVYDGKPVPAKAETAAGRANRRALKLAEAQAAVEAEASADTKAGRLAAAKQRMKAQQAAICTSCTVVQATMATVRTAGSARYIQAPYEADSQLALLDQLGVVDYVLTVDSDLVVLGVQRCLLKFNVQNGEADLIEHAALFEPTTAHTDPLLRAFAAHGRDALLLFSLAAGTDYNKFAGVGPGIARQIIVKLASEGQISSETVLTAAIAAATDGDARRSAYVERFHGGWAAFRHAVAFDVFSSAETTLSGQTQQREHAAWTGEARTDPRMARDSALGFIPPTFEQGMRVFVQSGRRLPSQCVTGVIVHCDTATGKGRLRLDGASCDEAHMRSLSSLRLRLPIVTNACRNSGNIGAILTFEQCPGAVLPDSRAEWTGPLLDAWLTTRNCTRPTRVHDKIALVDKVLAAEAEQLRRDPSHYVRLHDESGASMFEIMRAELADAHLVCEDAGDEHAPYAPPPLYRWVVDAWVACRYSPHVSNYRADGAAASRAAVWEAGGLDRCR
eukprot:COSAG01_NODE_3408_length_6127_cov_61.919210_6_plen_584_part_00